MLARAGWILAFAMALNAQSGRSYGPGNVWWNAGQGSVLPWEEDYDNSDGVLSILNKTGAIHTEHHAFFEALGTNGRACVTCHQPSNAMSVSAVSLRKRWIETAGKDPVFAAVDGSNCPDLPQGEMSSHSLLIERGLFRIELPWPPATKPDFRIEVVRDPTGCNNSAHPGISVYRRPRVAANLDSLLAGPDGVRFMADAREPDLRAQAITAILVHQEAKAAPSEEKLRQIVAFETQIYAAQSADVRGGLLNDRDGPAILGPRNLASGSAGNLGGVFSFAVWGKPEVIGLQREFRASAARGSEVFRAKCASCHKAGTPRWMDIGKVQLAELPLFRVTCDSGRVVYTQDPGRALISGKCADVGAIVLPQLRGLAARAPYFSNGSAPTLRDVVDFYDGKFDIRYSEPEKRDLVNFLRVL